MSGGRVLGLLGGMSWESSVLYEQLLNTEVRRVRGGVASADLLVRSYDFARIEALQADGDWDAAGRLLAADARRLVEAGAGCVLLCTNTMHRVADAVDEAVAAAGGEFLHLAEVTADAVVRAGVRRVGLLGTRYTMEADFYAGRLRDAGLDVLVPEPGDRTLVHDVIYGELVRGVVSPSSREAYREVVDRLVAHGAEGVVAGCTEIELLLGPDDVPCAWFPTTRLHALAGAAWLLGT